VFVNGELQVPGKWRGKPWNNEVGGEIIEFRPGNNRDYVLMDPSNAYPKKELKRWRRHIVLEKPVITVVLDEIRSAKGAGIETRFFSACKQTPRGNYMLLEGEKGTMALIPVAGQDFELKPGSLVNLPVKQDDRMRTVSYVGTVLKAKKDNTVIATIILPVEDEKEASAITDSVQMTSDTSGNYSLFFSKNGMEYHYVFTNSENGVVLTE
jgi:hypothetical protein